MVRYVYCVLILFDIIVQCSASSPYIIELTAERHKFVKLRRNISPSLVLNEPFVIHVYSDSDLRRIRCRGENHVQYFNLALSLSHIKTYYTLSRTLKATAAMNSLWKCHLHYPPHGSEALQFDLNVKVKDPERITERPAGEKVAEVAPAPDNSSVSNQLDTSKVYSPYIDAIIYRNQTNNKLVHYTISTLELNKSFTITLRIGKGVSNEPLTRVICYKYQMKNETYVNESLSRVQGESDVYEAKVLQIATAAMEGNWTCKIKMSNGTIPAVFTFPVVYIKDRGDPTIPMNETEKTDNKEVSTTTSKTDILLDTDAVTEAPVLLVNKERIKLKAANMKETMFNERGVYLYRNGELAKITCRKIPGNLMKIEYRSSADETSNKINQQIKIEKQDISEQTMYVKLTEKHVGSYFTCHVKSTDTSWYTVRLYFYTEPSKDISLPLFQVNGLRLAPMNSTDTQNTKIYNYEYYDGENLSIIGSLEDKNKKWNCLLGKDEQLNSIIDQHDGIDLDVKLSHNKLAESSVDCKAGDQPVRLTLTPIPSDFDPDLSGLPLSNTLYKYKQSQHDCYVQYNNSENKILNLSCRSMNEHCKWEFDDTELFIADHDYFTKSDETKHYLSKFMLKLYKSVQKTTVKCNCENTENGINYSSIVEIINDDFTPEVTQPPEVKIPSEVHTPSSEITNSRVAEEKASAVEQVPGSRVGEEKSSAVEQVPVDDETGRDENKDGPIKPELLAGIVGGTLLVVILVVWIIVGIHKRKRRIEKTQESNLNYENLPAHNEGAMAMPAQWDNYSQQLHSEETYSEPFNAKNVEQLYANSHPKCQPNEMFYAEPETQGPLTEYANIGQQHDAPAYAQVQPKVLRKARFGPQVLPLANTENYAQVLPKNMRKNAEAPNTNAFQNPSYTNTQKKSDYAEPAYCEVNRNKSK